MNSCRDPGLKSVKPHSVALGDRGVCPGAELGLSLEA